jgi:hypothetical protein
VPVNGENLRTGHDTQSRPLACVLPQLGDREGVRTELLPAVSPVPLRRGQRGRRRDLAVLPAGRQGAAVRRSGARTLLDRQARVVTGVRPAPQRRIGRPLPAVSGPPTGVCLDGRARRRTASASCGNAESPPGMTMAAAFSEKSAAASHPVSAPRASTRVLCLLPSVARHMTRTGQGKLVSPDVAALRTNPRAAAGGTIGPGVRAAPRAPSQGHRHAATDTRRGESSRSRIPDHCGRSPAVELAGQAP